MVIVRADFKWRETTIICTHPPPMYKAPVQFLDSDANVGRVMAHARLLMKLNHRFEALPSGSMQRHARIANYQSGKIVIHADNGAVASKLRQMSRRLCSELSLMGLECNDIEVKVQPRQLPSRSSTSTLKPISLKSEAVLRSTVESLPKGALRNALDTLLQRALIRE